MTISISFDYFTTKCYDNYTRGAFIMNEYLEKTHIITEIVVACYVPPEDRGAVHKQRASHGLALNCAGEKTYTFEDGNVCVVRENDMIYLPKGASYTVSSTIPGHVWCINFQCMEEDPCAPFVLHLPNSEQVVNAYKSAEKTWRGAQKDRTYKVLSELYKILYEMAQANTLPYLPETKQALIQPALDYIHKHYTKELINAQNLAELCGISYDYLRQLFEKFYGLTPIKYINALKLTRAKELLDSGMYSVSEAAYHSGFSDVSHFSRFFKASVGVLPSEYRN